jgi:hypothetical protein
MSDDWRLRVIFEESGLAHRLTERFKTSELKHDLETSFHDRLAISVNGDELFCYAGSRAQAEGAERLVRSVAKEHEWNVETELRRWHESAERWEEPDVPLPESDAERAAEHAELIQHERMELEERGYPEFEVRVQFESHEAAEAFANTLHEEGFASARRANYLVIGASDEDTANQLAERIRGEVGPDCAVSVEATGRAVLEEQPQNPFWFLGGLAG